MGGDDGRYLQCEVVFCGKFFECVVSMQLIATLHLTSFFMISSLRLIPWFPPFYVVTSMLFSIRQRIGLDLTHLICLMRVPPLSRIFLIPTVL